MVAILVAGSLSAQTVDKADLLDATEALSREERPQLREVEAVVKATSAQAGNWTEGANLTYEQQLDNQLIAAAARLRADKVSTATAIDFAKDHLAWGLAIDFAIRGKREWPEVLGYVDSWIAADPTDIQRPARKLLLRAWADEDVRTDVEAMVAATNPVGGRTGEYLLGAWIESAEDAGVTDVATYEAFFNSLINAATGRDQLTIRIHTLLRRSQLGANVNAELLTLVAGLQESVPARAVQPLYYAFQPGLATNEEQLTFYDGLLRTIELNESTAKTIRKIQDQKLKFE